MLKKTIDPTDPVSFAAAASLSYVTDTEPGIRRKRRGKLFDYVLPDGKQLRDEAQLARIRSLAIPPAYSDVWISPDPDGHIQATGRDERGRKQYRYHPRWAEVRDAYKYGNLLAFADALPLIRKRVDHDLRLRGLPRDRVLASIVWLLENTMIRVGNHTYARDNKSFGLTTLRSRHAEIEGGRLRLKFKGKSGKEWDLKLTDRRMVRLIRSVQDLPGQNLFQYVDEGGNRCAVRSQDVNDYIRQASGADFTSKNFRTWRGTIRAAALLAATELPDSKAGARRVLNGVIDQVASALGNTRAVCRKAYIHPGIVESWQEGRLASEMEKARRSFRRPRAWLDAEETTLYRWLEAHTG